MISVMLADDDIGVIDTSISNGKRRKVKWHLDDVRK